MGGENLGESRAVDLTGKIMVVVIIIMFLVVVIAMCIHLFARNRNYWWRPQSESGRRFVFYSGEGEGEGEGGLDPGVVSSLPVLVGLEMEMEMECAVCLSEVVEGEKARLLPQCNHAFHVACIDMWFQSHSTCPLCRHPVSAPSPTNPHQTQTNSHPSSSPATLLIHIPTHTHIPSTSSSSSSSSSLSPSSTIFPQQDLKSPTTTSLKRLFCRDAPTSLDLQPPPI
ncbi:hypothetical protein VNO78_18671 [Psophocarpus tetragonolobus]|uniref:RING-type domain-containing protein n=1 Tax=Psophocarpus tetragonolobus TaxID=3891 RepID=A0AAN9XME8_PSOTE